MFLRKIFYISIILILLLPTQTVNCKEILHEDDESYTTEISQSSSNDSSIEKTGKNNVSSAYSNSKLFSENSSCYQIMKTLCKTKRNGKVIVPKNERMCQKKLIKNITIVPENCKNSLLDELGAESITNVRASSKGMVLVKATRTGDKQPTMTEDQKRQSILNKYGEDAFEETTFMYCTLKKWEFKKFKEDNMKIISRANGKTYEENLRAAFKKEMKKFGCKNEPN